MFSSSNIFPLDSEMNTERQDALAAHLRGWIPLESKEKNPTYVRLIEAVLNTPELFTLAASVPEPQLPANVLFASVHFLLLQGVEHSLALQYPTVRLRHQLTALPATSLEEDFIDFTKTYRAALSELLATGITQTNEVARSAILAAVLCDLRSAGYQDIALLDAGCSAGLNLFVDRFHIDHSPTFSTGPASSAVTLSPRHDGRMPAGAMANIVYRAGLDQQPLDPSSERDATWLEACLWPDDPSRFSRLQAALSIASNERDSLHLHAGDLVGDLCTVAATIPNGIPLVIFSSWAAAYLRPGEHEQLTRAMDEVGSGRAVFWLSCEHPGIATNLQLVPKGYRTRWPGASLLTLRTCGKAATTVVVGESHPHAEWINLA
jgi:hypothetical protein